MRALPPRLARPRDQSAEVAVFRLAGPQALVIGQAGGLVLPPAPGRVTRLTGGAADWEVARASEQAPFTLQITAPAFDAARVTERLAAAGALSAGPAALECARILAGWPRLGAEQDDKTIPPVVRFEELAGVSYK